MMKDFPYAVLMRATWHYAKGRRGKYLLGLALLFFGTGLWLLGPYVLGLFFNVVQEGLNTDEQLFKAVGLILLHFSLQPITWIFYGPGRIIERKAGFYVRRNYVQDCYHKLQQLPYAWHQNFHTGQLYDRLRKAEDAMEEFTSNQFRYFQFMMNFIGPVVMLMILFQWFGIACVVLTALSIWLILKFDRKLVPLYAENNRLSHLYAGVFSDYIANIRTIIALRLGGETEKELLYRYNQRKKPQWREYHINEWKWLTIEHCAEFCVTIMIIAALWMIQGTEGFKIGSFLMLIQYLNRFSGVFYGMGYLYQDLVKAATNFKSAKIIDEAYEKYVVNKEASNQMTINQDWRQVDILNVDFSYEDALNRPHAIRDISLCVRAGEKIAFVGPSGAGKSTLMTLLRGLYQPDRGHVVIDGEVFPSLEPLANLTTLIPQDPEIFENTIRYNITFGVTHSDEEIMEACRMAAFDDVIAMLPMGLESDIREKGVNLSGGQKQRLALARGIFAIRQSSLVLMDEPTSSVDTLTEIRIFDRLFHEFSDKAIIASVHRLHLLSRFDTIVVIDRGKVIQQGSMASLIATPGMFAELWQEYQAQQKHPIQGVVA